MVDMGAGTIWGLLFGALVGVLPLWYIGFERKNYWGNVMSQGNMSLGATLFMGCLIAGGIIGSTLPAPNSYSTIVSIYSAGDAIGSKGTFVLGSGTINTDPVFIYYTGNDTVGYTLEYKESSLSRIFMDEDSAPYIKNNCVHDWLYEHDKCHYEFHVPHNAVQKIFNFNLGGKS
jgi:hypothetical protein